jgi:hypothetical protein
MKKVLKWLLIIIGIVVLLAGITALIIWLKPLPSYTAEKINLKIDYTPERVQNGVRLASMLCRNCHFNESTGKFTGREMTEIDHFGKVIAKNITRHPDAGIGKWTDGELVYFIRTGIKPNGDYVPPYMPKLVHLSDEDMNSLIAFLRSEHPWVQADNTRQQDSKPSFLVKFLVFIGAMEPFDFPKQSINPPDTANVVEYGKYIALYQMECFACHSKDFAKNDYYHPEKSVGFFGGGNEMKNDKGEIVRSANITMDDETGIGSWTEDEFVQAVRTATHPRRKAPLRQPMMPYAGLSENEVKAVYAYLKTIPKINNKVDRNFETTQ